MSPREMFFIYKLKSRFWNHARLLGPISYFFLTISIFKHNFIPILEKFPNIQWHFSLNISLGHMKTSMAFIGQFKITYMK